MKQQQVVNFLSLCVAAWLELRSITIAKITRESLEGTECDDQWVPGVSKAERRYQMFIHSRDSMMHLCGALQSRLHWSSKDPGREHFERLFEQIRMLEKEFGSLKRSSIDQVYPQYHNKVDATLADLEPPAEVQKTVRDAYAKLHLACLCRGVGAFDQELLQAFKSALEVSQQELAKGKQRIEVYPEMASVFDSQALEIIHRVCKSGLVNALYPFTLNYLTS